MTKPANRLSPKEAQVFSLRMDGLGTKEIAGQLGISTKTAVTHLRNVRIKLGGENKDNFWWVTVGRAYERQQQQKRDPFQSSGWSMRCRTKPHKLIVLDAYRSAVSSLTWELAEQGGGA